MTDPVSIQMWFNLFLAFAASVTVIVGLLRWLNRKFEQRIISEIREATYQIQPTANGGRSLADLHKKVDGLRDDVDLLKKAVIQLEEDVEELM